VRVLFVNHTAQISGGERSLLALLPAIEGQIRATVAAPDGDLSACVRALGVPVRTIPGTDGSLKLHPTHTPRAAAELARAAWSVRRIALRERSDLVHANSIRAGLVAVAAASMGGPPALVHVRDVLPPGVLAGLTRAVLGGGAAAIVGNSRHTLDRFAPPRGSAVRAVAYSTVDLDALTAAAEIDRGQARCRIGIPPDLGPVLGLVAQITPWKAQDDAVRIMAGLRAAHPSVRLVLVGSTKFVSRATRHDNRAFADAVQRLIDELGVRDRVALLGERDDIPRVLPALDMLLAPSWDEPFGRTVVEAMALGIPVAATSVGGPREVVRDGVDGVLLPPRRPEVWIETLAELLKDRDRLAAMSRQARVRARDFDCHRHAEQLLSLYARLLESS
jgi:L-malate glycosyltransferase